MIWLEVFVWMVGGFVLALLHLLPSNHPRAANVVAGGIIGGLIGGALARSFHWAPFAVRGFSLTQLICALLFAEGVLLFVWSTGRSQPGRPAGLRP